MVKNSLNIAFIIFLLVVLFVNVFYSCKCNIITENFEDVIMKATKKNNNILTDKEIKKIVDNVTNENNTQDVIKKIKQHINDDEPKIEKSDNDDVDENEDENDKDDEEVKKDIVLSKKEAELFNAIKKNDINSDELDRLVKSGVVNEEMITRFLQKMEEGEDNDEVEEFTSCKMYEGFSSCSRDYATF